MTKSICKQRWVLFLLCLGNAMAMTGCSVLNPGEETFSCSGMPGSIYCHSARDVYAATNDGSVPTPLAREGAYNPDCTDCIKAEEDRTERQDEERDLGERDTHPKKSLAVTDDELINNYVTPALPDRPVPIRTPSQVMRIWIGPFVDTRGDLQSPGFVYTEIEPRRWIIRDGNDVNDRRVFAPLEDARDYYLSGQSNASQGATAPGYNSLERYKEKQRANH